MKFTSILQFFRRQNTQSNLQLVKIFEDLIVFNNSILNDNNDKMLKIIVYGSYEEPLFHIDTIVKFLLIKNLKKFDINNDYIVINDDKYFKYNGLLKSFFIFSSSDNAMQVKKWYEHTIENKREYPLYVHRIFSKFEFPCIYLLYIGNYKEYNNVYKFGRTDNFCRRYKELNKKYNCIFEIIIVQHIDPEFLSKAELEVHKIVSEYSIKIDNFNELISLENPNQLIEQYKLIGKKYLTPIKILQDNITELEYKNKILTLEIEIYKSKN